MARGTPLPPIPTDLDIERSPALPPHLTAPTKERGKRNIKARKATKKRIATSERRLCGALKRDGGGKCKLPAGFKTNHPGYGKCQIHGGNSRALVKAAEREMVEQRMEREAKSMYGTLRDIGPQEALLEEVQRTAGHVAWLQEKIRTLQEDELVQRTAKDGMKESEWIKMYQEERKMLVAVCNTAIRCGIAERQVHLAEEQGKLIAVMLLKLINDSQLDLTPQQKLVAPKICRSLLLELSAPEIVPDYQNKVTIGEEIMDAELVDNPDVAHPNQKRERV